MNRIFPYLPICLLGIASAASAQSRSNELSNDKISVEAVATITSTGVKGRIKVTNLTNQTLYINNTGASVDLKKTKDGKSNWTSHSLKLHDVHLGPGRSVTDRTGANDNMYSGAYWTDVKNLKIYFGTNNPVSFTQPNPKCFHLVEGENKLFTVDGVTYTAQVTKSQASGVEGAWGITTLFTANNSNPSSVEYESAITYKVYYNGVPFSEEAKFKKLKEGHTETDNNGLFSDATHATTTPVIFLEVTSLPALKGISTGDRTAEIVVPPFTGPVREEETTPSHQTASGAGAPVIAYIAAPAPVDNQGDLLVTSDIMVELFVDGKKIGDLRANEVQTFHMTKGQHIVRVVPACCPAGETTEIVEVVASSQVVRQVKLRDKYGALEDERAARDADKEKNMEVVRKEEEQQRLAEAERVKKLQDERIEQLRAVVKGNPAFVTIDPSEVITKTPTEWIAYPELITLGTGDAILYNGKEAHSLTSDSIVFADNTVAYRQEAFPNVMMARVSKIGPSTLNGTWRFEEGGDFVELDFRKDGTGRFHLNNKRRVAGVKVIGTTTDMYRIEWSVEEAKIRMKDHLGGNDYVEVLDFMPGRFLFVEAGGEKIIFATCSDCEQLPLDNYKYNKK